MEPNTTTPQAGDSASASEEWTPLKYATQLAVSLSNQHYPNPDWSPLPDLMGVLSQIDNMTTGLCRKPAAAGDSASALSRQPNPTEVRAALSAKEAEIALYAAEVAGLQAELHDAKGPTFVDGNITTRMVDGQQWMLVTSAEAEISKLRDALTEIDAELDKQVYGLRSESPARGMRDADLDVPDEFQHDVSITERLWDRIRDALSQGGGR